MKTWIRRTLIGVLGATVALGGMAAWARHAYGGFWHGDPAEAKARVVAFATRKLDLDATQQAALGTLADAVQAQRKALLAEGSTPRTELQQLVAGPRFDRNQAGVLLQNKVQALQLKSPEVINAFGDFYDSLRSDQQQQLRDALARGHGRRHGRG